jgi:predicted dehydrogenase
MSIGIGIYGVNGHQIDRVDNGLGRVVAAAGIPPDGLPAALRDDPEIVRHEALEDLLGDPRVELVSLCSPRRRDQAAQAIQALRAGKHVYAEKPCAMEEADLDAILDASRECGRMFHEMAGTAFQQPYFAMREVVRAGRIGEVVQVICEKSYPWHQARPQDEEIDGGLIGQNAIHGLRFVEHVAGVRVRSVDARETGLGNPVAGGGLRMAASLIMELENGGLASVSANYLNPRGTGVWGDETLRVLGARGMVESHHGGANTRLVIGEIDHGPLDTTAPGIDYLAAYLQCISDGAGMPLSLEAELSPTRWVIRAKQALKDIRK